MVHWLGEGTNVMLCLAREPPPLPTEDVKPTNNPSAVYISYNNGNTFEDKTYLFQINDTKSGKMINSSLDQFSTHPTYNTVSETKNEPYDSYLSASIYVNLKEMKKNNKEFQVIQKPCREKKGSNRFIWIGRTSEREKGRERRNKPYAINLFLKAKFCLI